MAEGPGTLALVPQQAPRTGNSPKDVRIGRYPVQRNSLPSKVCSTSFALGAVLFSSSAYTFTTYRACRSCTVNHFRQRPPFGLGESPPVHCPVTVCSQRVGPLFRQTEGVLWWGGGGTRKATGSLVLRVRRTNTSSLFPSAPHAHTRGTRRR